MAKCDVCGKDWSERLIPISLDAERVLTCPDCLLTEAINKAGATLEVEESGNG